MRYLFEDYALDTDRRELWRGGNLRPMEPQAFDLLEFLVRNRERVVTRDDLLSSIWSGRIVSDSALNTRINAVRAAVGDDGESQRLIKTLRRKGLRFIGQVRVSADPAAAPVRTGRSGAPSRPSAGEGGPALSLPDLPSIAVMPFRTLGTDRMSSYFGDGIVEDIVTSLANLRELFVISRGSTLAVRNQATDPKAAGEALGVRYVVTGSVLRLGKRLRVWVALDDAGTGETLTSERHEVAIGDLFDMQDRIVEETVARIAPNIRRAELMRAMRKQPESLTAYDCTLRALDLIYRLQRADFDRAGALLERAREIDPVFSLPYAWGAWIHMYRPSLGWSSDKDGDTAQASRLAAQASQLDGQNGRALATLGHLKSFFHHRYDDALRDLDAALVASPNDPFCYALSSASLSYVGRCTESAAHAARALRLSPLDRYRFYYLATLGLAHYTAGEHDEAVKWCRISVNENGAFTPSLRYLAASLAAAGRLEEAREAGQALMLQQPGFRLRDYEYANMPFAVGEQRERHMAHLRGAALPE